VPTENLWCSEGSVLIRQKEGGGHYSNVIDIPVVRVGHEADISIRTFAPSSSACEHLQVIRNRLECYRHLIWLDIILQAVCRKYIKFSSVSWRTIATCLEVGRNSKGIFSRPSGNLNRVRTDLPLPTPTMHDDSCICRACTCTKYAVDTSRTSMRN